MKPENNCFLFTIAKFILSLFNPNTIKNIFDSFLINIHDLIYLS